MLFRGNFSYTADNDYQEDGHDDNQNSLHQPGIPLGPWSGIFKLMLSCWSISISPIFYFF